MSDVYKEAGVDINAGYEAVEGMKSHVKKTMRPEVMGGIGGFGAAFDLTNLNLKEPVLVSGTDGVGTKLKLAIEHDRHNTIGTDAVAMCVNDILTTGSEPLYFLDYLAVDKVNPVQVADIVSGIAAGCESAGAALIGGETAEMGGMYNKGEYDLAGFCVGAVEKSEYIDGSTATEGDKLIGLASSGVHSNGYSLVRKLIDDYGVDVEESLDGDKIIDLLLEPTRIYVKDVQQLKGEVTIRAMSHITGGGFLENIPRMMPEGLGAKIDTKAIDVPKIITWLMELGEISRKEAYNIFNMGIGFVIVVRPEEEARTLELLGDDAAVIGEVVTDEGLALHG